MKLLYTLIMLLLLQNNGYCQKILFSQNFNAITNYALPGWSKVYTGSVPWQAAELYIVTGECYCGSASDSIAYRKVAGICDCGIIERNNINVFSYTPPINTNGRSNLWLRYDAYFKKNSKNGKTERFTIEVSTTGGVYWQVIQDVPAKTGIGFETYYINLNSYLNQPDVRIGFRYSDDGGAAMGGCAFDDVVVFEAEQNDLQLTSVTPVDTLESYVSLNTGYKHTYNIFNYGLDTIKEFVIAYSQNGQTPVNDTIRGVSIPSFTPYSVSHSVPDTIQQVGKVSVKAWVSAQNDLLHNNDTLNTSLRGAYFIPKKAVVLEEGTGTWHMYAPRGHVYLKQAEKDISNVCLIAAHSSDPMELVGYEDYLFQIRKAYVTYFLIDRTFKAENDSLFVSLQRREKTFGFAELTASSYTYNDKLTVDVNLVPAIDMTGDYRVQLVLTEDGVTGTGSNWAQKNGFANNAMGAMGGYENKPNPVPAADMVYNYVARSIHPSPEGKNNLPSTLVHNRTYSVLFDVPLKPEWNKNNMRAHVLLVRHNDSTILNATKAPFKLSANNTEHNSSLYATLYPNPTTDNTTLVFYSDNDNHISIVISDISGRTIQVIPNKYYKAGRQQISISTAALNTGLYLVTLTGEGKKETVKMQVLH